MPRRYISPKKTVEYLREKDPYGMAYYDDREVYKYAQKKYPDMEWPIWPDDVRDTREEKERESLKDVDTSPFTLSKLATSSVMDLLADDGVYFKDTYNKSSAGLLYQALHGKPKYHVDDYEPELMGEIGQFFLGHLAPLDLALFFGSGSIGSLTANYAGKKFLSGLALKGLANATEKTAKNVFVRDAIAKSAIHSGLGLGLYGASGATLAETARQSTEMRDGLRTEYDPEEIIWNAAKAGLQSAAIGAVSGGLVKAPLGTKYGFAKMKGTDKTFKDKVAMAYANPGGQVFLEANAFSGGELYFSDEEFNMTNYMRALGRNTAILGGLRLLSPSIWKGEGEDIKRITRQTREIAEKGSPEGEALKNANERYKELSGDESPTHDMFVEQELLKKAADGEIKLLEEQGGYERLAEIHKKLSDISNRFPLEMEEAQRILNKAVDKGKESLSSSEKQTLKDVDTWLQESNAHNDIMLGLYSDFWVNKEKYYKILEKEKGEPLTDAERKEANNHLEEVIDRRRAFHDFTNAIARGDTPVTFPEGAKFKFWQEQLEAETTGRPPDVPPQTSAQLNEINKKVIQVAGKMEKSPDEVRNMKDFIDKEGNVIEAALDHYLGYQPTADGVSALSNKEYTKISKTVYGVSGKRKLQINKIDKDAEKKIFKASSTKELDNFEKNRSIIRHIIQEDFIRETGGPGGKGDLALKPSTIRKHVKNIFKFSEFLSKRGKNFETATRDDVVAFMRGKTKEVATAYNYFQKNYFEAYNEDLKGLNASKVIKMSQKLEDPMQGARIQDINIADNTVTIFPSKGTSRTPTDVVISEGFTKILQDVVKYNKENVPAERWNWTDADGLDHQFLFWKENKLPLSREDVTKFFNNFTGKGEQNISGVRKINPKTFRKSFITWANEKYKGDTLITEMIDKLDLMHESGDMIKFYKMIGADGKTKLRNIKNKYIDEIFGDIIPEVSKGKEYASTHELRQFVENVRNAKTYTGDVIKFGSDYMTKNQALALLRHGIETSARWTDIVPSLEHLKDELSWNFRAKTVNKTIKNARDLATIGAWEAGDIAKNKINRRDYQNAKKRVSKEGLNDEQADAKYKEIVKENKDKLQSVVEEPVKELTPKQKNTLELKRTRLNEELKNQEALQKDQIKGNKGKKPTVAMKGTIAKIADIKLAIDRIERKLGVKFQVLPQGDPAVRSVINKLLARELKKNPGLKTWVNEKSENKEYAGKFHDGLIELTLGKANEHTFFHENAHRFKEYVNKIGNKELSALVERGEKMFAKEAREAKQSAEEYFTDRMADYGAGMSKGVISKMKNWGKLMLSKLKKYVFGTDKLNKNDIARLLGSEVFKGFDTRGVRMMGKTPKFKFDTEIAAIRQTRSDFNRIMNALGLKGNTEVKKIMQKFVANLGDIEHVDSFIKRMFTTKGIEYDDFMKDVSKFHIGMSDINIPKLAVVSDKATWFSHYKDIELLRTRKGVDITKDILAQHMKKLGVESGNIWDASPEQLKKYLAKLKTIEFPDKSRVDYLDSEVIQSELAKQLATKGYWVQIKGRTLPIHEFLDSIGLSPLADKMRTHSMIELKHISSGYLAFEEDAKKIVGRFGVPGRLHRIKDRLWTLDQDRYKDALAEGTLTKGEKDFISKAVDEKWQPNTDTIEGKLAERYNEFTGYYKETYKDVLRQIMTEAEHEKFVEGDYIKWIEEGFYVSRILTKEFKQKYNMNSKHIEEYVHDETVKLAREEAINKYKTTDVSNQQIAEFLEVSEGTVRASIYDMMNFSTTKVSSRFLKKRHLKLPERIGKIKVYETSYDKTMKVYASAMSKFLANVEIFPEYVSMNGFNYPGVKAAIQKVQTSHGKWGDFIVKNLEKQLGKNEGNPFEYEVTGMQKFSNTLAKVGLSFPTAGLKNIMLGTSQTALAFRMRDMFIGLGRTTNKHDRASVRRTGATEMSLRYLETGGLDKILDASVFRAGMMKPTEHFNRYLAVLTSRVEQERLVNIIRNKHMKNIDPKKYEKSMRRLKDFYRLSEEDIVLLEKYGMEGIDGHKLTPYEMAVQDRKIKNVYQKMDSMAHINTQGASMDLFMPEWAGKTYIKPLTLYKRMAFAATDNTINNARIAWKNKEMMRLLVHGAGTYLTGQTLIAVGHEILGNPPPKENSSWWSQMLAIMWRGELLGLLSEFLSPHVNWKNPLEATGNILKPAVIENAQLFGEKVYGAAIGVEHPGMAIKDYTKRTVSLYNNTVKTWETATNPYKTKAKRWSAFQRDFEKEFKVKTESEWSKNIRTPYYKALREAFLGGTEKEFVKQYIITWFAVANDMYNEGYSKSGTIRSLDQALKDAKESVDRGITNMNPNPTSFYKKSGITELRALDFSKWIIDGMGVETWNDMRKTEKEYFKRVNKFYASLPYKLRQFNLGDLAKKYIKKREKEAITKRKRAYFTD